MTIEAWEHVESTDLTVTNKDGSATSKWVVRGAGDEYEAQAHLALVCPIALALGLNFLIRQKIDVKHQGAGLYLASVDYGPENDPKSEKAPEPLEHKFAFDTTGGKHKISLSEGGDFFRQWAYSQTLIPPDLKGAMNYDGKKVHGVDITVPNLEFTITVYFAPAVIDITFVQEMGRKTGRVNSDPWLGFLPGELLFLGATGDVPIPSLRGQKIKPIPIQLKFAASENRNDIVIGSNPQPITKQGWDYLWVRYERMENGGLDYPVPVHAYVNRVYTRLAFKPFFKFG